MAKYRKKEKKMIDMSGRLNIQIVPASEEEIRIIEEEFDNLNCTIEKRTQSSKIELSKTIRRVLENDEYDFTINTSHFIDEYDDLIKNNNHDHIRDRIEQYRFTPSKIDL